MPLGLPIGFPPLGYPDGGTPYSRLHGRTPSLAMAKVFGCLAHVWVDPGVKKPKMKLKFGPRARWAIFIGISPESKGWEFFIPSTGEIGFLSRDAHFHEDLFFSDLKAKGEDVEALDEVLSKGKGEDPFPKDNNHTFTLPLSVTWSDELERPRVFSKHDPPHSVGMMLRS